MIIASEIFMIRPASFGFNPETSVSNEFQRKDNTILQKDLQQSAVEEFDAFVKKLQEHKISVTVFRDSEIPVKPDAIFPNNWLATMPDGQLIIFPMEASNRRIERSESIIHFFKENYFVRSFLDLSENENQQKFLEGTGSIIMDHANEKMYACISSRTNKNLFIQFAKGNRYEPIYFDASLKNGKAIYHTNVMMHVGEKYAVLCTECIHDAKEKKWVVETLKSTGKKIVDINIDQMKSFAGNMLQVKNTDGNNFTILSQSAFDSLTEMQKETIALDSILLPISINTIETAGGGSVRCMMAEIFLQRMIKG